MTDPQRVVLGEGRTASRVVFPPPAGDLVGETAGFLVTHPGADGEPCLSPSGHFIPTHSESPVRWTIDSMQPLTLSPSLACRVCGDHGFIREGRWVPA